MLDFVNEFLKYFLTNPLIIMVLVLGLLCGLFQKQIIGWLGEYWTRQALRRLPKDRYIIINNVFIYANGSTHQIDHVVVSPYGIFSIETKQYNGFITGDKYDKYWIRHDGKKKYNYTNPIRQNYGHVKSLSMLLNIDEDKIYNIVCIPSRAKLRIKHDGELVRYDTIVDKILSYNEVIIYNVNEIVKIINDNNIKDKNIKKGHIENINKNIIDKNPNICPKCGGQLVIRNGKYGKFIGCSNYPNCRYKKDI